MRLTETDDDGAVGVTEHNLSAHIDELIYEEESALEHLLMDEYATLSLGGCDEEDAQKVWRQPRPWSICYGQDRAVHEGVDLVAVGVAGDEEVIALLLYRNT